MKTLELIRSYLPDRTIGTIKAGHWLLKTLERPWNDNERNVSCIPEGRYIVKRDTTGRHQWFAVQNVIGRSFIELHGGITPFHSDGCILIGTDRDNMFNLKGSDGGLDALLGYVGDEDWQLIIRQYDPHTDNHFE